MLYEKHMKNKRENISVTFSTTMYDKHFPKYEYEAITFSCKYESEEKTLL